MFETEFAFKFRLRNLVVEVIETELEYKMYINKKDMKISYVKESEKKKKKNRKILQELEFEKYRLARKLREASEQLETNFHMKKMVEQSRLRGSNFQNNDTDFFEFADESGNVQKNQQMRMKKEKTTIRPARVKQEKVGSKMRIFEELSEQDLKTNEEKIIPLDSFNDTNQDMEIKEMVKKRQFISEVSSRHDESRNLDSIFEDGVNNVSGPNTNSRAEKTLIDFDESVLEKQIKTPFD